MKNLMPHVLACFSVLSLSACLAVEVPLPAHEVGKSRTRVSETVTHDGDTTTTVTRTRSSGVSAGVKLPNLRVGASSAPAILLEEAVLPKAPAGPWNDFPGMN